MVVLTRILIPSHPLASGKFCLASQSMMKTHRTGGEIPMVYSYTQIAQYLRCPRSYRYRYLEGWKEKDSRATLLFGRCFEQALGAYFRREDSSAALFTEWTKYQEQQLEYSHGDSWERMFRHGVQLLERLAQDDRIEISRPSCNLQIKLARSLPNGNDFV